MESLYKKKNLKFSGFHKELNKAQLKVTREASRQKRFSMLRDLNCSYNKESGEKNHELPELCEKKTGIPSRQEMLKKWKEEKAMKQRKELEKKPVVKPGFCLKKPTPRVPEMKNKTDDFRLNVKHVPHPAQRSNLNIKPLPAVLKSTTQPTKTLLKMPKKPAAPVVKSFSNIKPQMPQRSAGSKSLTIPKSAIQKLGPSSLSQKANVLQGKPVSKETKPAVQKIPNPTKPYPQPSKIAAGPDKAGPKVVAKNVALPKVTQKLQFAKPKLQKDNRNINAASSDKPNNIAFPNRFKEPNKKNQTAKGNQRKCSEGPKAKPAEIFSCDISTIEPDIRRKSFAPHNFLFCPPSEWSFPLDIDVSSLALSKIISNGVHRTSSPIKISEQSLKSSTDQLSYRDNKEYSEEKSKTSPDDNECESNELDSSKAKTENKEVRPDISEIKIDSKEVITTENGNMSFSDLIATLNQAVPNDINSGDTENLSEKVTEAKVVQSVEPTPVVALDNGATQSSSEILLEKLTDTESVDTSFSLIISDNSATENASALVVSVDTVSQNSAETFPDSCFSNSIKNLELNAFLEPVKCFTREALEDNKLINIESPFKPAEKSASKDASLVDVPTDSAEDCLNSFSSNKNPEQEAISKPVKCAILEIPADNKLINLESPYKQIDNSVCGDNAKKPLVPIYITQLSQNCHNSDQDKSSKTENKSTNSLLLSSTETNGYNGNLTEVENHVDSCALSETLATFNLAASLNKTTMKKESTRYRKSKMPPRNTLESINESIESKGTPCVTPKFAKKLLSEENFTPRRSARLSGKLNKSGSFESLLNIEKPDIMSSMDLDNVQLEPEAAQKSETNGTPVSCKKKSNFNEDFTPRRSQRLKEMLRRSSSYESLFDVRRPSVLGSPCMDDIRLEDAFTYDFDNLALEDSPKVTKGAGRAVSKKVSLLYTPPARKSILRQSIRADLMSFTPP